MSDLKDIFSCDKLDKFKSHVLTKLTVDSHVSASVFYLCEYDNIKMLVKMYLYRKNMPELYDYKKLGTNTEPDTEIKVMEIFKKEFIEKEITPCIAELYYSKVCENIAKHLPNTLSRVESHTRNELDIEFDLWDFKKMIEGGLAYDKIGFLIMELCNDNLNSIVECSITPTSFTLMRNILFQLIYTLAAITDKYPKFVHGDLHYGNILLSTQEEFDETKIRYTQFTYKGKTTYLPYLGFYIKMIDFGYSSIPEKNIISSINDDKKYKYYLPVSGDLTIFLYTIFHKNPVFAKLFNELNYSDEYLYLDMDHSLKYDKTIPSYLELLDRPFFDCYRPTGISKSNIYKKFEF